MLSATLAPKMNASCGTSAISARKSAGSSLRDVDAVERDRAARGIVEPQRELEQRRLARAGRADDGDDLAGRDAEAHVAQGRRRLRARDRRSETSRKASSPRTGFAQLERLSGRDDARLDRHDLADAPGGAGGLRDLVPDFRQLAERAGAEHGEQHELRQRASGHPVSDHVLRAEPKHDDDAAEGEEERGDGDERARLAHGPRRLIGAVGGLAIAAGGESLRQERLHDAHRRQAFGGEGGRVREPVLGAARTLRAPSARPRRAAAR